MSPNAIPLPLRVYQTDFRIMVAAPMPRLEPRDIAITVTGYQVTIHGKERRPHQHERALSGPIGPSALTRPRSRCPSRWTAL
jgi:HSP20 family molecular chaperone IbpA